MQKQKKNTIIQSIEELISDYSRDEMATALAQLENELSWKVLRAALMKEYVSKMVYIMDYSGKTGQQIEAARESGCAATLYDIANSLIEQYKDVLRNKMQIVEQIRPEE